MNKLFGIIFCVLPFLLHSQSQFKVELNLVGLKNNKVRVSHIVNGKSKVDTLTPKKEDYILWEGKTVDPQLVRMEVLDTGLYLRIGKAIALPPALMFMLTNGNFVINGNAKEIWTSAIVTNDEESLIYEKFRAEDLPLTLGVWEIQKEQNTKANAKDTLGTAALKDASTALRRKNQQLRVQYIDKYPAAFSSILMLQGKPIGEPVMQYGPFVMNTKQEINEAFEDYHKTQFGGWPWPKFDQVHPREKSRFAKHSDGKEEVKTS